LYAAKHHYSSANCLNQEGNDRHLHFSENDKLKIVRLHEHVHTNLIQ